MNFFDNLENPTKLNLGCGTDGIQDGYINIDIRDIDDPRVLKQDVRNLQFEPESVDEINAIDVYEHISHREAKQVLKHWVSLLKPGGIIYIQAPCLTLIAKNVLSQQNNVQYLEMAIALTYGAQDYEENFHKNAIEPLLIASYLKEVGINGDIMFQERGVNLMIKAIK